MDGKTSPKTYNQHNSPDVTSSHSAGSSSGNNTGGGNSRSDPLKYLAMVAAAEMSTESSPVHSPDVAVARALDDSGASANAYQKQQQQQQQQGSGRVKRGAHQLDDSNDDTCAHREQHQHQQRVALGHPGASSVATLPGSSWLPGPNAQQQQQQHHQHMHVPLMPAPSPPSTSRAAPRKRRKQSTSLASPLDGGGGNGSGGGQEAMASGGISDDDKQKLIADAMIIANTKGKGDKPYACAKCERSFTRKHDLIRHITVIHLNAKPFACQHPACNFSSNRKDQLVRHLKNRPVCLAFTYGHRHEFPGLMAALDQDRHWTEIVRLIQTGVNGEIILPNMPSRSKSSSADAEDEDGDQEEDDDDESELVLGATVGSPNSRERNKSLTAAASQQMPLVRAGAEAAPSQRPTAPSMAQETAPRPLEPAIRPKSAHASAQASNSQPSSQVPQGLIPPLPQYLPPPPPPPPAAFGTRPLFASPPPLHPPAYPYPTSTRPAMHAYEPTATATASHNPVPLPPPPFTSSYPPPRTSNPSYVPMSPPSSSHFAPTPQATTSAAPANTARPTRPPWIHQEAIITSQGFLIPFDIAHVPPRALADAWYLGRTGGSASASAASPASVSVTLPEAGQVVLPPIVSSASDASHPDSLSTSPTRCPRPTCPTCSPSSPPFPSGSALLFHLQTSHECRTYAVSHRDKVHFQLAAAIGPSWIAQLYHQYQAPPSSSAPSSSLSTQAPAPALTAAAGRWPPGLGPIQPYAAGAGFVNPLPTPPSSSAFTGPPAYAPAFPPLPSLRSTLPPLTSSGSSTCSSAAAPAVGYAASQAARQRTESYSGPAAAAARAGSASAHPSPYVGRAEIARAGDLDDGGQSERDREREHQQRLHGVMSDSLA
ncbi:hypothetical protein BCR44DRAFT_61103 [Catenaria anguillulae PL171]|uniref:C2H2-type domain-containing protein n=1 Tax=Catenaria anguillulae PL171 TaxID=765915 RepID=A0A1Y2HQ87_9FUNG|nr:hypothetical protein BCR44DRAFT_61103 [Catenaria anguillulae PL171]